ncbi:hypothetical protein N7510_004047 [Penicillium lagena]|uniref:uncharacterized protein n=1 Tax=Penicillium lagena TaxID=94218 RepID=UPI0025425880|nr:uncharacterized protein N7510_004047 [Penicillium lagena]KAJ5620063.1 hypothetical protein N7510_004047 [Penicillium lagena]
MSDPRAELQSTLRSLSIGSKGPVQDISRPTPPRSSIAGSATTAPKPKKSPSAIADSWEDEAELSADDNDLQSPADGHSSLPSPISGEGPLDPPPTPISPQTSYPGVSGGYTSSPPTSAGGYAAAPQSGGASRRPEKQTAVAGRLIAGALGIRAPKRTEEQRSYDRAVKEQEIRRRNREREELTKAKEEDEKLKTSVWND